MNVSTTHVPMVHSVLMVSTTSRAIVDRGIRENAVKPVRLGLRLDYVLESICSRFLSFSFDNEIKGYPSGQDGPHLQPLGIAQKKKKKNKSYQETYNFRNFWRISRMSRKGGNRQ